MSQLLQKIKLLRHFNNRSRIRVVKKIANKFGLIYFGSVDQHSDDHKVVRGFTVSSTHDDDSYCVGNIGCYGITIVDRNDVVWNAGGEYFSHNWLIIAIELNTKQRVPHFLLSANNHDMKPYSGLFSSYPNMMPVKFGTFESYDQEFLNRFTVYARPAKSFEIERLLPEKSSRVIGAHFWPLSIEQHDNVIYVYAANEKLSQGLLETMIENGLWFAKDLDEQAELV